MHGSRGCRFGLASMALTMIAALTAGAGPAQAQAQVAAWPDKSIKMIVPFAAGGGTDLAARLAAKHMSTRLGQQVFVENRGGANGILGLQALKQAAPDGYTIATASDGPLVINPGLYKEKLPYDTVKDFTPVHMFNKFVGAIVVHPSVPAKSIKELIDYARANPGKLNYSTAGLGNFSHMGIELFMAATGTKFVHVPFTGVGPGTQALVQGDVQLMFNNIATVLQQVEVGQLRLLGVGEPNRLPAMPNLPAVAETVTGFEMAAWTGVIGPAGLPKDIVAKLAAATAAALKEPEVVDFFAKQHMVAIPKGPDEFAAHIRSDLVKWTKVIDDAGIKIAQ